MFKKLIIGAAIIVGIVYGSGSDFSEIKRSIVSTSHQNARDLSGASSNDWGPGSGY